ncbi:MAG: hypothetical protein SFU98_06075 [Leptospiraceae bacterium]|nr:hypothetical protein [Leptospiraceae bacterium]
MGIRTFITILILLSLLNCSSGYVELHDPAKLPLAENYDASKTRMLEAEDCGSHILILFPVSINTRFRKAYRKLMNFVSFDEVMIELSIEESWTYILVGTRYCTTLRAKIAKVNETVSEKK